MFERREGGGVGTKHLVLSLSQCWAFSGLGHADMGFISLVS